MADILYSVCAFTCALITLILPAKTRKTLKRKNPIDRAFIILISATSLFCLIDGIWGILASELVMSRFYLFLFSSLFHIAAGFMPIVFLYFALTYVGNVRGRKVYYVLAIVFFAAETALVIVNIFTRFIFDVNEAGIYESSTYRRILFYAQFFSYILIALVSTGRYIRLKKGSRKAEKNNMRAKDYRSVILFTLAPIGCCVLQMVYADMPAYSVGYTIGCCIIYTFVVLDLYNSHLVEQTIENETMRQNGIIKTFTQNFEIVHTLNLETGRTEIICCSADRYRQFDNEKDFGTVVSYYIENCVYPEDRALMAKEADTEAIRSRFARENTYEILFREVSENGSVSWFRMNVTKLTDNIAIVGFSNVNREILKKTIDEHLLAEYASIFLVDLENDYYHFIYRNEDSGFADVPGGCYSDVIREYATRVDPDYRDEWTEMIDPKDVKKFLSDKDKAEYVYPLTGVEKSWRRSASYVIERDGNGDASKFIMTYMTLDSITAELFRKRG